MTIEPQKHGDAEWPGCWLFYIRGDIALGDKNVMPDRIQCGNLVTYNRGVLTYRCTCGSTFTREPGFQNAEARAWVAEHVLHIDAASTMEASR